MPRHHNTSPPATFEVSADLAAAVAGFDVEALTTEVGWRCLHCDGRLRATHLDPEEWVQRIGWPSSSRRPVRTGASDRS